MPTRFRKQFRYKGVMAHVHKRKSGKSNWNYEIRCQIEGIKINVSSNDFERAKQKFIDRLDEIDKYGVVQTPAIPTTFDGFANYYFETFYKRKVCKETYRIGTNQYKNHIAPHFNNMHLKRITPKQCQELLDRLDEQGKGKTADDVFSP